MARRAGALGRAAGTHVEVRGAAGGERAGAGPQLPVGRGRSRWVPRPLGWKGLSCGLRVGADPWPTRRLPRGERPGRERGQPEASGDPGCGRRPGQGRAAEGPRGGKSCWEHCTAHGSPGQRGFNEPVGFCRRDFRKGLDREL